MLSDMSRLADFPGLTGIHYLNTAAENIPPTCVGEALQAYWRDKQLGMQGRDAHFATFAACREIASRALCLAPEEVSFCSCSSEAYNLLSSALSGLVNHSAAVVAAGVTPTRMGNSHPSLFPYDALPTADGEMIITAGNDRQFRRLCEALGIPELADDPRFASNADRTANREELRPLLVDRLKTRTKDEWFREIIALGVPCGPINTVNDGVAFAEELGLDPVVRPGGIPSIRNPITFSETPARYVLPPPGLDEHGAEIRAWLEEKA